MMRTLLKIFKIVIPIVLVSCSAKDNGAQIQLDEARSLYAEKQYALAEQRLDSLHILYPKSLDERKAALALLDSVRRDSQIQQIAICDSLININTPVLDSLKKLFVYQRNKQYQDKGFYIPKESATDGRIIATTLRSGVEENGTLYIESVFVGNSKKHFKLKASTKDGSFAETMLVTDDGLNYRFSSGDIQHEIIKFSGADENGIARFISANAGQPLTLTLDGQAKYTYTLSQPIKTAISKSYQLSMLMQQIDSLGEEKKKAEFHLEYLNNGKKIVIDDDRTTIEEQGN